MTMTTATHTALQVYMMKQQKVRDLLAQLTEALDRHHDCLPENINWGHVGDLTSMGKELQELAELYA